MLDERNNPLRTDQKTEHQLADYLDESKDAWVANVQLIEEKLKNIEKEGQAFGAILESKQDVGPEL